MTIKPNIRSSLLTLITSSLLVACSAAFASNELPRNARTLLLEWNERVLATAEAEDKFLTLKGLRTAAMLHIAVHDALNAIKPRFRPYRYRGEWPEADPLSAAVQAAFEVSVNQYPEQSEQFTALLQRWLPESGSGRQQGIELGKAVAAAILDARANDGWNGEAEYTWHPMAPGVYAEFAEHSATPEGFVFGSGWAVARPFMLHKPDQFRTPPPPAIDSPAYTEAFNEVKELGRFESPSRTADQTHLALWWKDFAENSHNRLARELVTKENIDLWAAARLFALLNMSIYDAYISVFDNKFYYNHWRPYTAIRWAANDGNANTEAEPNWNNTHQHTYAFPSYPSAHGTACAAAMSALAQTFGDDYAFTMTTKQVDAAGPFSEKIRMNPPQRSFARFSDAAMECTLSRIYLGIHFRYDSIVGNQLGMQIGRYAADNFLNSID